MRISRILQLSHQLSPDDCARVAVGTVFHYTTQKGGADPAILLERYCDSLKDAWLTRQETVRRSLEDPGGDRRRKWRGSSFC